MAEETKKDYIDFLNEEQREKFDAELQKAKDQQDKDSVYKKYNELGESNLYEKEKYVMGDTGSATSAWWNMLICQKFLGAGTTTLGIDTETVDIITNYEWCLNRPTSKEGENGFVNVPFLYAIEMYQKYGATASNLMNNLYSVKNLSKGLLGMSTRGLSGAMQKVTSALGDSLSGLGFTNGGALSGFTNKLNKLDDFGKEINNGDDKLLGCYEHLYAVANTGKKFCFPFFGEGSASWSNTNDFSADGTTSVLSKAIMGTIETLAKGLTDISGDIRDISNYLNKGGTDLGGFTMFNMEKAKAFSFPTTGRSVSVKFPLFNTTKKDAWKDNYKFILLFAFRNMLFRKDNVQYYQPLLYDVSIPGWGRLYRCFVKQFSVKPVGMIRTMTWNSRDIFYGVMGDVGYGGADTCSTVTVPEAWVVQIDFQSLIAESGNQLLSSLIDLPILTSTKPAE